MNTRGETPEWQRRLKQKLGENPARFLDHDLIERGPGHTDQTLQRLVFARIRGIDKLGVVNAWIAVERKIDRGPRDRVIELLKERKTYLTENGDRELPNWTAEERRARAQTLYDQSPKTGETDEEALSAAQKLHRLRTEQGESA